MMLGADFLGAVVTLGSCSYYLTLNIWHNTWEELLGQANQHKSPRIQQSDRTAQQHQEVMQPLLPPDG